MQVERRSAFLASRRKSSSLARFCFSSCNIHLCGGTGKFHASIVTHSHT